MKYRIHCNFGALILVGAILVGAGSYRGHAAGVQADTAITAMIDLQRAYGESEARKTAYQKADEYARIMEQRFNDIATLQYLNTQETRELHESMNRETPTDADKKRVADLKVANGKRADEIRTLSTKKEGDLTQAERARLRELNTLGQDHVKIMEDLRRVFADMVNGELERQLRLGLAEIRTLVGKLAKEQGITQVFDTSSLVYATIDLTPAVIQKVTAKKK